MNYATQVLRNEVLMAAIENLFVPVLIYNSNGTAHDKAMLKEFDEPSWNNPVARVIDTEKKDVIPRINGIYSVKGIAGKIIEALEKADVAVSADALDVLKQVAAGKTVSDEDAAAFRDSVSSTISRELAPELAKAVKAYEAHEFGEAYESAVKMRDEEDASEAVKSDAAYVIALVDSRWAALKSGAEKLAAQREYLQLQEKLDAESKKFKGYPGAEEFFEAQEELLDGKEVKVELKALKKLAKLEDQLKEAKTDREREAVKKALSKFAEKEPGTRAAEKAAELAK